MTFRLAVAAILLGPLTTGCESDATAVDQAFDVRVEAAPEHLVVTNGRHESIHYFILDELAAPLIEWVPCTGTHCPTVQPQTIERVPYSRVVGDEGGAILFYWWPAVSAEAPVSSGSVRLLRVER